MKSAIQRLETEVEQIRKDICEDICKWIERECDIEELMIQHCEDCPLGRL